MTTKSTQKITVIESAEIERDYGFKGVEAIIDHPAHGKLLIIDGFGGADSLRGGAVRWEHGSIFKLQNGDTLENLKNSFINDYHVSIFDRVVRYSDPARPVLHWDGFTIENVAKAAGL